MKPFTGGVTTRIDVDQLDDYCAIINPHHSYDLIVGADAFYSDTCLDITDIVLYDTDKGQSVPVKNLTDDDKARLKKILEEYVERNYSELMEAKAQADIDFKVAYDRENRGDQ